jgi:hypothetical protein
LFSSKADCAPTSQLHAFTGEAYEVALEVNLRFDTFGPKQVKPKQLCQMQMNRF